MILVTYIHLPFDKPMRNVLYSTVLKCFFFFLRRSAKEGFTEIPKIWRRVNHCGAKLLWTKFDSTKLP